MSTYSNLKLELIGTGEQTNTWGTTTNNNWEAVEQAVGGYEDVDFATDADKTLTYTDSNGSQVFRALYFNVTSSVSLTATRTLYVPAVQKMYVVKNATTGDQSLSVAISGGVATTVLNGETLILYADGVDVLSVAPGLFYFDESKNSASPNATVPVEAFSATGAESNIDTAIVPKGTGSILAAIPNSASAGGNKRGTNAVDLQTNRSTATEVAGGNNSVLTGGVNNTVGTSATSAVVSGGNNNTNSAATGVVVGGDTNNLASTATSGVISGGKDNANSAMYAVISGGRWNTIGANSTYATIVGGYQADATRYGQEAIASGAFSSTSGTAQISRHVLRVETTSDTQTRVTADGTGTADAYNTINMPSQSLFLLHGFVVAKDTNVSVADAKVWELKAAMKRGANASDTALLGSATVTELAADAGASGWAVVVEADTTNGGFAIRVTGASATTIRWVCNAQTTEAVNG